MTPERRTKLIHRLCLFAPQLSAASIALVAFTPLRGLLLQVSQNIAPALAPLASVAPVLGWFLLTLGCSAVTAIDFVRRRNTSGNPLIMRTIFGTALVFFAHVLVLGTIAFAGCVIALNR